MVFRALVFRLVLGLGISLCANVAHAQSVTGLTITTTNAGSELLTFAADIPILVTKSFVLPSPHRVVIDISRVDDATIKLPKNNPSSLIKAVRFGQFDASTSRIVLDLHGPAKIVNNHSGNPFTVEIMTTGPLKAAQKLKPLIVIDAGHGGQDPGAIGKHGTREKDITLNYAKLLRAALLDTGRYRVALTREDDRFIMLPERVAIARKEKADLFISLHADSNPNPDARGLSIYTLSENASDDESAALAERVSASSRSYAARASALRTFNLRPRRLTAEPSHNETSRARIVAIMMTGFTSSAEDRAAASAGVFRMTPLLKRISPMLPK